MNEIIIPDLTNLFNFFIGMFEGVINILRYPQFRMYGYNVCFFDIIVAFLVFGFVISLFWRGAKS